MGPVAAGPEGLPGGVGFLIGAARPINMAGGEPGHDPGKHGGDRGDTPPQRAAGVQIKKKEKRKREEK